MGLLQEVASVKLDTLDRNVTFVHQVTGGIHFVSHVLVILMVSWNL